MRMTTMTRSLLAAVMLSGFGLAGARAEGPTRITDSDSGFSADRLAHLERFIKADVDKGLIPGAMVTIWRKGKIAYQKAWGVRDVSTKAPIATDTIFRIYSMTKPLTSVAAMMLVEEARMSLEDPVAKYIPSFANVKVGVEKTDAAGKVTLDLVAPRRPMTVQDLLRHTSGLTYGFFGEGLVKKGYVAANLNDGDPTTAEFVDRLAAQPLMFQPGTTWDYSQSTDVLGRVVEVVTGKPLMAVLKDRILDPLGMKDTTFYVTDTVKHSRIAEPFPNDRTIGVGAMINDPRVARKYESGGGGMVSTTADYTRFLQMLVQGGSLDGKRYLSAKTIASMTSNHSGPAAGVTPGPYYLPGAGYGFGLGFAVRTEAGTNSALGSVGEYNWGGAGGTAFWVDPKENMFVIFMMQSPSQRVKYRSVLRNTIYGALEK